jgi:hypothetical protein
LQGIIIRHFSLPFEGQPADTRTGSRTANGAANRTVMSQRNNQNQKADLALALATGGTVKAWADAKGVAERTARTWSHSPEVVRQVQEIRREAVDRAVGKLSEGATVAAEKIARLVQEAGSESVQLSAARAVLADLMSVSNYAALEQRLVELERRMARARPAH